MADSFDNRRAEILVREGTDRVGYWLQLDRQTSLIADHSLKPDDPLPSSLLFEIHFALDEVVIYPLSTLPSLNFLRQKYDRIRSITFEHSLLDDPPLDGGSAVDWLRENMIGGFIRDPVFGLGVIREMRPWLEAVEQIPGVQYIRIVSNEQTRLDGTTYIINEAEYHNLRLAFQRIALTFQAESLSDRKIMAHNEVLHALNPETYPEQEKPYKADTIYKLLGGRSVHQLRLRGRDRNSVLELTRATAKELSVSDPEATIKLQRDIELVNLDEVIRRFRRGLEQPRAERAWQRLFEANPFILTMAFGYPIVDIQSSATVGNVALDGGGAKIVDFLKSNPTTLNAAIVEIKKPQSELLGGQYRSGVRKPSAELIATVVQVLDQRHTLMTNLASVLMASRRQDLRTYSVDCVVVMGKTPADGDVASFELMRTQFKDVRIITYDELLIRLEDLRDFLAYDTAHGVVVSAKEATVEDANDEFWDDDDGDPESDEES